MTVEVDRRTHHYDGPLRLARHILRHVGRHLAAGPNVAWSFVAMAAPDLMEPMFTEIQMRRLPEADFEAGGRRYGVFGHDWRLEPARGWLQLKAERALRIEAAVPARNPGVDV